MDQAITLSLIRSRNQCHMFLLPNDDEDDRIITSVRLPRRMIEELDALVEQGIFINRSEAIRAAIRILLERYKHAVEKR